MGKRLFWALTLMLLAISGGTAWAKPAPSPAPPSVGPKAGAITALLPTAKVVRGSGKAAVTTDAKKGDELIWNDLIKTEKGGRARITLSDQSILSLGSQAELRIVRHDAKSQQTALQMTYGRVRAQVANITRDGGKFELRTPTAVAGVIGTDWGVDSSPVSGDTFVCLSGAVQISNIDPSVAGSVQCTAGMTTTVQPGKAPTPPKPASLQQLQQLIEDTEPAMIGSMSPAAGLPGANFDSTVAGAKMGKVTGVAVAGGNGVTASVKNATDDGVTLHVVVDQAANPGPLTFTLTKETGAASATVFTVLGLPTGDPKKAYLDTLDKLRQTGAGGLNAFLSGAQQAADQVAQQITSANLNLSKPLDLTPFADSLNQQYGVVQGGLRGADTSIDKAAQDAANTFSQLYDSAYSGLLQRDPSGNADATFNAALMSAFQQANGILQNALNRSQTGLSGTIQQYGSSLDQIQQTWSQNINKAFLDQQAGSLPKVNALERIVELGSPATFSAGSSVASNSNTNITSYNWTLCNKAYRPSTFGQPLDSTTAPCVPLQGFQSTNADFQIATCSLEPGIYFARLAVTDLNNRASQMDVRLTVLEPSYTTPSGVVRNLADAYNALQYSQFIRWFDASEFNGYTFVAENIRQTMLRLATMSINLRVSQENIACNDATVRADWQQNYSFQDNPKTVFRQEEQLSARLRRVPGKGWYIVDFQGDNGQVQGVPGPQTTDTAAPDLVVTSVDIGSGPLDPAQAGNVFPGTHTVTVTITNNGRADLTQPLPFTMSVNDGKNQQASTFTGTIPAPLAVGKSTTVSADMPFPQAAAGTPLSLIVSANPACNPPEKTCGSQNNVAFPLQIASKASYVITGVTFTGHAAPFTGTNALQNGETTQLQITVANQGNLNPAGAQVFVSANCAQTPGCQLALGGSAAAPAGGTSTVINIPFNVRNLQVASYSGTITLTTDAQIADVGPTVPLQFDVVDFSISPNVQFQVQNVPIGGSGDFGVAVTVQTPGGTTLAIPVTPQTASNLSFTPPTIGSSGSNNVNFTANVGAGMQPGAGTITVNAANHGVVKSATFPANFFSAAFVSTSLFVNDQANPLAVPVAIGAQAPNNYPTIALRFAANFLGGPAPLGIVQPTCGNFVIDFPAQTAQANDTATMRLYAAPGNTCPAASRVVITADIPQTFPSLKLPVYTLFVTAKGLPQLAVVDAVPTRDLKNFPWLAGEPLDWTVTIKNSGSGPSAGGEKVTIYLDGGLVGQGIASSIAAGQQATVAVHTVGNDIPENAVNTFGFVRVAVDPDTAGDLAPGFNSSFQTSVNVSDWGIQVTSQNGFDDNTPLNLQVPNTPSGIVSIGIKNAQNFNPGITLGLVQGAFSQGQLNTPGISPAALTAAGTSNITIGYPAGATPVDGFYLVQIIAQMKDGATVTTQRQVTIHVRISNQATQSGQVLLASDRNNIANCFDGCQTPQSTVQINGPLPEAFTLTASLSFCSAGSCPGSADVTFSDPPAVETTPSFQTVQVLAPGNTLTGQVKARDNPDGSLSLGPATVQVSVTAIQAQSFAARNPHPDPIGNNQFQMIYNVGDIFFNSPSCLSIAAQNPQAADYAPILEPFSGFNLATVSWEWQDANHVPVGAGPLSFGTASGSSTLSGQIYPLPTFPLTNSSAGIDGLQTYFFAVTVSNGTASATKYFPIQVDLSQAQTFCPVNLGLARGSRGGSRIAGSWGKAGLIAGPSAITKAAARAAVSTKAPDLRINATDVSFTPSMPKSGDTVSVRFRITNLGDADAKAVPVALQVNGVTVTSDTFDVAVGRTTLGGLEWANAKVPAMAPVAAGTAGTSRLARGGRGENASATPSSNLQAQIVIDPQRTMMQKSTVAKSAALAHFGVRDSAADATTMASATQQRVVLQLAEGGCAGLKFAYGAGGCSGDVTITVEDLAKGTYKLEAANGIADLGVNNSVTTNAMFGMNAFGQNGHTYAVQLKGGKVGLLTMQAVRNPDQLSEAAKRIFRGQALRAVRSLGGTSGAPETGDTAPTKSDSFVYFDITFQGM